MKQVSIALPEIYIVEIEKMKKSHYIPNHSAGIRMALREFLSSELQFFEKIKRK